MSINTRPAIRAALGAAAILPAVLAITLPAGSARAANPVLDAGTRLGGITLDRTSGEISPAGGPQALTTASGCPEGFRGSSRVLFVWPDGTWPERVSAADSGLPAQVKLAGSPLAGSGLDGNPVSRTGTSASRWGAYGFPADRFDGHSGVATYVITCDPGELPSTTYPDAGAGVGGSRYFSVDLRLTWDDASNTGTWEVVKETTATTLTAVQTGRTTATLTARVAPASAAGEVTFTDVKTGATLGTAPVADGVATLNIGGLRPRTYTFAAAYSGNEEYAASESDAVRLTCGS